MPGRPHFLRLFVCLLLLPLGVTACRGASAEAGPVVVILANAADLESLALARHYAQARAVPEEHIIALDLPATEEVTWRVFVDTLQNPLMAELVRRGWIDAIPMDVADTAGRRRYAVSSHRIAALVVCRGVPFRIAHDPALPAGTAQMATNAAAVDSELALLAADSPPLGGYVPNPLFQNDRPRSDQRARVIPFGRLDGPTPADARRLVDNAILAERQGLIGRAYVDIGGPHPQGDDWLEQTAKELADLGFDTDMDRAKETLPATARFDAPALYFGWYAWSLNGPLAEPGFVFPPGAIALHIHSASATTMRDPNATWAPALVARGVTATFGNVNEPFLAFTHQPQLLLKALVAGRPLGEAALYSLTALSWQSVVIGDPLYRPFTTPFESQWEARGKLPSPLAAALMTRRLNLLGREKGAEAALAAARGAMVREPSYALALACARLQREAGDRAGAVRTLGVFANVAPTRASDAPLAAEAARRLVDLGQAKAAVAVWARLLGEARLELSKTVRIAFLGEAKAAAGAAGDADRAVRWDAELTALTAPPPPPPTAPADAGK